eukprot:115868-Amphidinium_carterae.1
MQARLAQLAVKMAKCWKATLSEGKDGCKERIEAHACWGSPRNHGVLDLVTPTQSMYAMQYNDISTHTHTHLKEELDVMNGYSVLVTPHPDRWRNENSNVLIGSRVCKNLHESLERFGRISLLTYAAYSDVEAPATQLVLVAGNMLES